MAVYNASSTDYLRVTSPFDGNAAYSIGGWYQLVSDRNTFGYFMAITKDANNYDSVATTISGTTFRCELGIAGSFPATSGTTDLVVGNYYFVVAERESATSFKAYLFDVNGTLLESLSLTNSVAARTAADLISLGNHADNSSFWLDCRIGQHKAFESAIGTDGWRREMFQYSPLQTPWAFWPLLEEETGAGVAYHDYGPTGPLTRQLSGGSATIVEGPPSVWRRHKRREATPTAAPSGWGQLLSSHRNRLVAA
jgi:hypothetical protein